MGKDTESTVKGVWCFLVWRIKTYTCFLIGHLLENTNAINNTFSDEQPDQLVKSV